jgi:flagellar biosynthesis/type III secretory pathway protein FliH
MKTANHVSVAMKTAMGAIFLFLVSACDDTPSPVMPPALTPQQVCQAITGCAMTAAGGFTFPDGAGGTITCTNGICVDQNSSFSPNYNNGYSAGQTDGYNTGYNNGVPVGQNAGYNAGYNAGQNSSSNTSYQQGYNQGSSQGQSSGYNDGYTDGQDQANVDAYNSGYNAGYNSSYGSAYNGAYDSNYDSAYNSAYNSSYSSGYYAGYDNGYDDGYSDGSYGYNVAGGTKDVDLQRAVIQEQNLADRAEKIANQFHMSLESATQLTHLTQKMQKMAMSGQMTLKDRQELTKNALNIAGLTPDEVNQALSQALKGDRRPAEDLIEKVAHNLGMDSSTDLRDKLLPNFGIQF